MSTDLTPRGDDRGAPDDPDRIPPKPGELATLGDEDRFPVPDPGLEEHLPRLSDVDEKAGDRQARIVATFFGMVPILAIIFVVIYFAVPKEMYIDFGPLRSNAQNVGFGLTLGLALLVHRHGCRPVGAAVDVRRRDGGPPAPGRLQRGGPDRDSRHDRRGCGGVRDHPPQGARSAASSAAASSPCPPSSCSPTSVPGRPAARSRRPSRRRSGPKVFGWSTTSPTRPIKAEEMQIGQLVNGQPENLQDYHGAEQQIEKAKASIIIVRMDPNTIKIPDSRRDWQIGGILCYSKICTHVGCPISLWEQQTHHLLCPCHQSTFDLGDSGVVVFGPAARVAAATADHHRCRGLPGRPRAVHGARSARATSSATSTITKRVTTEG